tara:strand:+ start:114 stop:344 length:231 start_codon:yes stop_codon:yes gene_type:complete
MSNNKDFPVANPINNNLIDAEYVVIENTEPIIEPVTENYCGPKSCIVAGIIALIFWPASLCVLLCPCDTRIKKKKN